MIATTVEVGTDPTLIVESSGKVHVPNKVRILNPTDNATVYVGGPDVTTATGFPIAAASTFDWDLIAEPLYGVVASETETVNVATRG